MTSVLPAAIHRPRSGDGAFYEPIASMLVMLAARDAALYEHALATAAWCRRLAAALRLPAATAELLVQAAALHDIGTLALPADVAGEAGPLTGAEWPIVRAHAERGAEILAAIPALERCAPIVRAHHERYDGTGYPDGLAGTAIPLEARIIAVADGFHAMISPRPHRPALPQRDALAALCAGRGAQWDARIIDTFVAMLGSPPHERTTIVAHH